MKETTEVSRISWKRESGKPMAIGRAFELFQIGMVSDADIKKKEYIDSKEDIFS
ncbi:MAG: hypothetical protein HQM08_17770 [Candidatus Riflebacteria bacterium]|nr:hypothetical protein [Candidatus Riflebacteria bacterium]